MSKNTLSEQFKELELALVEFKQQVAQLLINNPRILLFWLAMWVIIRITVEWVRDYP